MPTRALKTKWMILIEAQDPKSRSIQQILKDSYAQTGSMRAAAKTLGLTVQTFSAWVYRLGVELPETKQLEPSA